jgi:23S rRNA pseudouridine1911/1915/1917 synthase
MKYEVRSTDAGERIDVVVATLYPDFTRSSLGLLFDKELVKVNDQTAKPSYKVKQSDKLQVDETLLKKQPSAIKLPIIYEDHDVIVIDKPAGILAHSKGALNLEPTVASFIKSKITDKNLTGNRAGIVHRLDRGTSGVMVAAKNTESLKWLQKQFSQRKVKKHYLAVVEGVPEPFEAIIDAPIARNPKKPQTFMVAPSGKPALTKYKVVKSFEKNKKPFSEIELAPQTGRTHQLRVHMAYINHPVADDAVYGHGNGELLLHARSLEITLPSRERKTFELPIPKRFKDFTDVI